MSKTHYDTLGVGKEATQEEIKKVFRKLSMETHPDLNKGNNNVERFKQVSEAYNILGNDKSRKFYDFEQSSNFFGSIKSDASSSTIYNSGSHNHGRKPEHGMHRVMETVLRPRNFFLLTFGVCSYMAVSTFFTAKPVYSDGTNDKVEAWMNPKTKQWETPAPWDPVYQEMQPTLQFVHRSQVKAR